MNTLAVSLNDVSKKYKDKYAVEHMTLEIKKGEIYGLIGKNGAGKSTLLKMISGLAHPTSGSISLFHKDPNIDEMCYRRLGTLIENAGLYPNMNAYDNLKTKSICLGYCQKGSIEELLSIVGLSDAGKKKVKSYSLGMKQRLGIAMALIGNPDLLILDEPINGLDPQGIQEIRDIILKLNVEKNMTIMISSHILGELSRVATSYGIIHDGKLIRSLSKAELSLISKHYYLIVVDDSKKASFILERAFSIHAYEILDDRTIALYEKMEQIPYINQALVKEGVFVNSIQEKKEGLEEYFFELMEDKQHD